MDDTVYALNDDVIVRVSSEGNTTELVHTSDAVGVAVGDDTLYWSERTSDGSVELRQALLPE